MPKTVENEKSIENEVSTNEQQNQQEDIIPKTKKSKSGVVTLIIGLLFFLIITGSLVAILGFNAFNIREKYLRSTMEKIPIVRMLLSPVEEGSETSVPVAENVNDLKNKILELEKQVELQNNTINTLSKDNDDLNLENKRLKEIESMQADFKKQKEEFDNLIALNDPTAYSTFYEKIAPENAENLYVTAKISAEQKRELKKYTETFEEIDADTGAKVLEEMIIADIDLVVLILKNVTTEQRAKLIAGMGTENAAKVVKYLAPQTIN